MGKFMNHFGIGGTKGDRSHPIRIHARVSGLVQGVGFRYFAVQSARRLGVTGWVRNRLDGDVEAEAQGPRTQVDAFVAALHEGPRWGHVDAVDVTEVPPLSDEPIFAVRR